MEKRIDISVVVPIYNVSRYLGECLESILSHKNISIECICVDDASTDSSYDVLCEYAKADDRIIIYKNEENKGLASTRNVGARNARGKYLYFIDSDDYLVPGALNKLMDLAEKHKLDMLGFTAKSFFEDDKLQKYGNENEYLRKRVYEGVYEGPELFAELMSNNDRAVSNIVLYFYNREFYQMNNLYCGEGIRYADDSMFLSYMAAKRVMLIQDQLYMRRYREGSECTSTPKFYYLEGLVSIFVLEWTRWFDMKLSADVNCQVKRYFDKRLISIHRVYKRVEKKAEEFMIFKANSMEMFFYQNFVKKLPVGVDMLSVENVDKLKSAKKIILYGAGIIAEEAAEVLRYYGLNEFEVVVSGIPDKDTMFGDKKVQSVDDVKFDVKNVVVLVAVSQNHHDKIRKTLEKKGLNQVIWYGC